MEPRFKPGSPEAIAQGCTCPPQAGPAEVGRDGTLAYTCDLRCPMHGLEVIKEALLRGEASIIEPDDDERPRLH